MHDSAGLIHAKLTHAVKPVQTESIACPDLADQLTMFIDEWHELVEIADLTRHTGP